MSITLIPHTREGWLALAVLVPKAYVLAAYPLFLVCLQFAPRNRAASEWGFALLLGYLGAFVWLAFGAFLQKFCGSGERAQSTALTGLLALIGIWLLWPSLAGGF